MVNDLKRENRSEISTTKNTVDFLLDEDEYPADVEDCAEMVERLNPNTRLTSLEHLDEDGLLILRCE